MNKFRSSQMKLGTRIDYNRHLINGITAQFYETHCSKHIVNDCTCDEETPPIDIPAPVVETPIVEEPISVTVTDPVLVNEKEFIHIWDLQEAIKPSFVKKREKHRSQWEKIKSSVNIVHAKEKKGTV